MPEDILQENELRSLLRSGNLGELRSRLSRTDPADVADFVEELDQEDKDRIFSFLDPETASEVIVEMEPGEADDIIEGLSPEKLAGMIREMAPDDAADFYADLDDNEQNEVLEYLSPQEKKELFSLLGYDEESAGGLMTPEFCAVPGSSTVQQAMQRIIDADFADPISMVFAVDENRRLIGSISVAELIAKPKNAIVRDIVEPVPVTASLDEDQETIANNFRKYDLYVMPVVDDENRLVGRITADDVMDVMHEEANEDLARMAGAPDIEHAEDSPFAIVALRLPWLMITLLTGILISAIIKNLIGLSSVESLAAFVPVILAMGGNTGMQASAVTIRSIALGEIRFGQLFGVFIREILVGLMMGTVCGILTGFVVWLSLKYLFLPEAGGNPFQLAAVVGMSMCTAMTFAAITGTFMPILLNYFKVDPAVASGPFVTTGNDLSASLIYFLMCYLLI